jgi:hypothetical protein
MSNKRELYNSIVAEVREYSPFPETTASYIEVGKGQLTLDDTLTLESKTSAFSDIAVRDAVLIDAMKDEIFAFVLINKIINTTHEADDNSTFTQHDLEALTLAGHIATMWEQATIGVRLSCAIIPTMAEKYKLVEPSLNKMNRQLIDAKCASDDLNLGKMRKDMVSTLEQDIYNGIDESEGAE